MWTARSCFVSQLHGDGSGWNDCFEASLLRYLREVGTVDVAGDVATQLAAVAQLVRGVPDAPGNADTTLGEAEAALQHYGAWVSFVTDWSKVLASPFALCFVNGIELRPSQYPASWFDNANYDDHFILRLPNGAYNDPLVPSRQDVSYDEASVRGYFGGAYLLPWTGAKVAEQPRFNVVQACALKVDPNHVCSAVARLAAGAEVLGTGKRTPHWTEVQTPHLRGWLPTSNLAAVG